MKKLFAYIVFFCFHLTLIHAATFHVILVGDTKDKELHEVIKKDLKHMNAFVEKIFDSLDVDYLEQVTYSGKHTNSDILDDLNKLKIRSEDIVLFYFSGHGFFVEDVHHHSWPFLYLSEEDTGIDQLHVCQLLANHQPRLLICMADCCNNVVKDDEIPDILIKGQSPQMSLRVSNLQKLFLDCQGTVVISSASPGYYAEGTDEKGSCFTNRFIKIFQAAIDSGQNANWEDICDKAQQSLWKEQQPQYQLNIK